MEGDKNKVQESYNPNPETDYKYQIQFPSTQQSINNNGYSSMNQQFPNRDELNNTSVSFSNVENLNPAGHVEIPPSVYLSITNCETCACMCCCLLGCVMIIFALVLVFKDNNNNNDGVSVGRYDSSLLVWNTHWLYMYGFERDFIEPRMGCNKRYSQIDTGCFGMKYPHDYKIKCLDCGKVLKEGHDSGSLAAAIIFGIIGCVLALVALIYFLN